MALIKFSQLAWVFHDCCEYVYGLVHLFTGSWGGGVRHLNEGVWGGDSQAFGTYKERVIPSGHQLK